MTETNRTRKRTLSESEVSENLCLISVRRGLRLPQTPDEVEVFEQLFASELADAEVRGPRIEDVRRRARDIRKTGFSILTNASVDDHSALRMAARNGTDIAPEIERQMDEALAKAKRKVETSNDR